MAQKNNIKALLEERGMSVYRLAKEVEMSYQAVHALVNAPVIPPGTAYGTLVKIAGVLSVTVDELQKGGEPAKT